MTLATDGDARILKREQILPGIFRITCSFPGFSGEPGQFVEMEPSPEPFPMTRRPFTLHRKMTDGFEVVFEIKGSGTEMLAILQPGQTVRTLGPLGRGWRLGGGRWLLVGGGLGAAGFPFLAASLPEPPDVLLGASTRNRLLSVGPYDQVATEDGSRGLHGLVTDLLRGADLNRYATVAVCGPVGMMKAVWEAVPVSHRHKVQVSTESRMGCGWGICEGCPVPGAGGGYRKSCTEGPVFFGAELDWERWEA